MIVVDMIIVYPKYTFIASNLLRDKSGKFWRYLGVTLSCRILN